VRFLPFVLRFTAEIHYTFTMIRSVKILLIATIACLSLASVAQDNAKTSIFIPVSKTDFPSLKSDLDQAMAAAGLKEYEVQTTDFWHRYQQGLRHGRPGIYLAAPHYASWAIDRHQFTPILRLEDDISYVVAARRRDISIFEIDDLNDRVVCSQPGLNLDFLLITNAFTNPLHSAQTESVSDVVNQIVDHKSSCNAFVISNHLFLSYDRANPEQLIRVQQSQVYPPYAWLAHPDVHADELVNFLKSDSALAILAPVLQQFSEGSQLLRAKSSDYPRSLGAKTLAPYWGETTNP